MNSNDPNTLDYSTLLEPLFGGCGGYKTKVSLKKKTEVFTFLVSVIDGVTRLVKLKTDCRVIIHETPLS